MGPADLLQALQRGPEGAVQLFSALPVYWSL